MGDEFSYMATVLSIIAIIISVITWKKTRPIEQKEHDKSSLTTVYAILGTPEIVGDKKIIADEYNSLKERNKPAIFEGGTINHAVRLQEAFNQVSILYQSKSINQKIFRQEYGGHLVRFWKIMKDDITKKQEKNPNICKNFQDVAKDFMDNFGINEEPYKE
jgi:hypothetical protein